jgi:hypothetical protein
VEKSSIAFEKMIDKIMPAVNDPAKEIERLVGNAFRGESFIAPDGNTLKSCELLFRLNIDRVLGHNGDERQENRVPVVWHIRRLAAARGHFNHPLEKKRSTNSCF